MAKYLLLFQQKEQRWIIFTGFCALLSQHKIKIDLSRVQLDGSQILAKRGGDAVGYQGRKKVKTPNIVFLSDNNGQMLSMSHPRSGHHNDVYEIDKVLQEMLEVLEQADINTEGLFMNADAGFDSEEVKKECEQKEINLDVRFNKCNGEKNRTVLSLFQ